MNKIRRNRRGFLLAEETLKIIVAVICIIFLAYILIAIYNSSTSVKKVEEAKNILNRTDTIVSSLKEGAIQNQDLLKPKGWHLYSFIEEEKPNSCLGDNCLCICSVALIKIIKSQAEKCDKEGACLVVSNLATSNLDLKITGAEKVLFIGIRKQGGKIFVGGLK